MKTYQSQNGFNYTFVLFPEIKFFSPESTQDQLTIFKSGWYKCFSYIFLYIVLVHLGRYLMKSREKYDMRNLLISWNISLAIFSILGTIRIVPEFIYILKTKGIDHSICINDFSSGVFAFWGANFALSKLTELFDTIFVVLRKQPLQFLHWYHHATVLLYCWYSVKDGTSTNRWFMVMNHTVHSLMNTYYAFRAMRYKIPKLLSVVVTISQISQMILGFISM